MVIHLSSHTYNSVLSSSLSKAGRAFSQDILFYCVVIKKRYGAMQSKDSFPILEGLEFWMGFTDELLMASFYQ